MKDLLKIIDIKRNLIGHFRVYSVYINQNNEMRTLDVTIEIFNEMLSGLIASGVTFEAKEKEGRIFITFTGGC
jgi:hypothetical protein